MEDARFKCDQCNQTFGLYQDLDRHVNSKSEKKVKVKKSGISQRYCKCACNGGAALDKSVNVTLIPPTITSGPPGSWITRVCQYPRPEK